MNTPDNPRKSAPTLAKIAAHWATHPDWPNNRLTADPTKPQCMRCGFAPPCDTWDQATGWIERSHLLDHYLGGSTDIDNLVPLCPLCNWDMNGGTNTGHPSGLDWVKDWRLRDRDVLSALVRTRAAQYGPVPVRVRRAMLRTVSRQVGDLMATFEDADSVVTALAMLTDMFHTWNAEAEAEAA